MMLASRPAATVTSASRLPFETTSAAGMTSVRRSSETRSAAGMSLDKAARDDVVGVETDLDDKPGYDAAWRDDVV
jgi:hypothetical protein